MERKSFAQMDCSVAQCLEVVGEWWSLLVLRDIFLGIRRFDRLQRHLGIARNVLQQRLEHLVDRGVLERRQYEEHPPRYEYHLTQAGRDLWPVLNAMRTWGDRYAAPDGPPLQLVHRGCGKTTEVDLVCRECGETLTSRDVVAVPGPGRGALLAQSGAKAP